MWVHSLQNKWNMEKLEGWEDLTDDTYDDFIDGSAPMLIEVSDEEAGLPPPAPSESAPLRLLSRLVWLWCCCCLPL